MILSKLNSKLTGAPIRHLEATRRFPRPVEFIIMQIVTNIEKIQNQIRSRKPLWVCLDSRVVSGMAIGWILSLAKNSMMGIPSDEDLKNHDFMVVERDAEKARSLSA